MKKAVFVCILLAHVIVGYSADKYYYREVTGVNVKTNMMSVEWNEFTQEFIVISSNQNETHKLVCESDLSIKSWTVKDFNNDTEYYAVRSNNIIILTGRFQGENIEKEFIINNDPWYEIIDFNLIEFIKSEKQNTAFWIIQPTDLSIYKMVATREIVENISVNNAQIEAVKVKITLGGILGIFWRSYYWFRKPDGVLIKYEGVRGGPGIPITTISLIREE